MPEAPLGWISASADGRYTLTFEREFPHAQEEVWKAITSEAGVGCWLSDAEIQLRPNGRFRLSGQCNVDGEVLEARAPALFRWTWPHPDHPASEVQISIACLGEAASRLMLSQTELPKRHLFAVAAGWHTHLDALSAAVLGDRTPFDTDRATEHYLRYSETMIP